MSENQIQALRLLKVYTAGYYDVYSLAGPAKASVRAHIMSTLAGKRVPQSQAGINAIRDAFMALSNVTGTCQHDREENFAAWANAQLDTENDPFINSLPF